MKKADCVIDTNILLVSISSKSQYHWIYQAIINDKINIYITNDILMEYEEIIAEKYNDETSKLVTRTLLLLKNVHLINIFYKWDLITVDGDDNKFVDCYIASGANYLVTEDRHFGILQKIQFPQVNVINLKDFEIMLKDL